MANASESASEMSTAALGGGFSNYKEAVYNAVGNFFIWLSTHQGLVLIIVLIVLGIGTWLILRTRNYRKQLEKKVSSKSGEIKKKDTLIGEQKNKLSALERKLSDQQGVASGAMLQTITTLTGYDIDQLKVFFKFLTEIKGNPLQIADTQETTIPDSQGPEEVRDAAAAENDEKEKIASDTGTEKGSEANKSKEA
jgi:hypothetical protein